MSSEYSELSHPVRLDRLTTTPQHIVLEPDRSTLDALAGRFDLQAIERFRADLSVRRRSRDGWIEVSGTLTAAIVQTCVVTTEPVSTTIDTELLELFDDSGEVDDDEIVVDPVADSPEPISGESIDVGEIAAQSFGLALDPYPRAPGAEAGVTAVEPHDSVEPSPFAGLAALKGRAAERE